MGTPGFAVPCLDILEENGYNVVAVITATDKLGGRGMKTVLQSDVKKAAIKHGIPVLQPKNLKHPDFVKELASYEADLQIVVAFRMLPVVVWDMPRLGTYNLHGSLLPKYRGAAPIHWAVINGEEETGVTSFKLKHEIDTGNMLFQKRLPIHETDTTGDVHDRMMILGSEVILKTVQAIESGEFDLIPQDTSLVTKAPKLFKENCEIDFDQDARTVYNFIRGLSPFPVAWTRFEGKQLKIYNASFVEEVHENSPGSFDLSEKGLLKIACKTGYILPKTLQLQGRKRMDIKDFLNGIISS